MSLRSSIVFAIIFIGMIFPAPSNAQQDSQAMATPRPLITQAVDETRLSVLKGNTHPLARPEFDLGTAPASLPMERMLLVLKRSDVQEIALRKLLDDQQDKNSSNYHKWLTPEQFGGHFGPTDADLQTITNWLQSHGFQVGSTKGRTVLEFSGSASQVQEAFHTSIHKFVVNGEQHWANASDPQIPSALAPAVAGISSLHDFRKKAMNHFVGTYSAETKQLIPAGPDYTFPCSGQTCYGLVPYDFAAIYDVTSLWSANINGAGQTIAIVGRTNINQSDATTFWSLFGLTVPQNKLTVTLNGPDPGINGDEGEADIDVQWSGAVAPQALINFVTSQSTNTTDGVDLSALYIVENNLASIVSESYGQCELGMGTTGNQYYANIWAQAAAQGISVFVSSGDNGSAGCDDPGGPAQYGLNVNGIASTPFNAAVGGTDFNQYNKWTQYWTTNNATTQQSAKGYIPETTWNDSCTNALAVTLGYGSTVEQACNNPQMLSAGGVNTVAGSGGPSNCVVNTQGVIGSCTKAYAKPSWQTGTGQTDQARDLPDISLFASNGFMGSFYVVCQSDQTFGSCTLNNFVGFGGTSVASPAFAGIMALVNQKMGSSQGVPGFALYKLVSKQPNAFHDIPTGSTIGGACVSGTPNCRTNVSGDTYGVMSGYSTSTGYDLATGLGSVDVANLVNNWNKATFTGTSATLTLNNASGSLNVVHGTAVPVGILLSPTAATGNAALLVDVGPGTTTGKSIDWFTLSGGSVSGTTSLLPAGSYNVIAHYGGDGTYGGSYSNAVSVTVSKENSTVSLPGVQLGGSPVTTVKYDDNYTVIAGVENAGGKMCNPPPYGEITCPTGTISLSSGSVALGTGPYTLDKTGFIQTPTQAFILPTGTSTLTAQYSGDTNYNANSASIIITVTQASTSTPPPNAYGITVGQQASLSVTVNTSSHGAAPTGSIKFYSNGKALAGTISYNSNDGTYGYASLTGWLTTNATAFPTPGSYAITATYSGDTNYLGSTSAATNVSVLYPTPTMVATPNSQTLNYGSTAKIAAMVDTTNKSTYPTGTITFQDAYTGTVLIGPTSCTNTTDTSGYFACQASGSFSVTSGDPVNISYSGDANYPSSNIWAFITMPDFSLGYPGVITVSAGQSQSVTLTVGSSNGFSGTVTNFSCSGLPAETACSFSPTQVTASQTATTTLTITTTAIGQSRRRSGLGLHSSNWALTGSSLLVGVCFLGIPLLGRRGRIPTALGLIALLILVPSCGGGGSTPPPPPPPTPNPVPHITSLSPAQIAAGSQIGNLTINGTNFMGTSTITVGGVQVGGYIQSSSQIVVFPNASQLGTVGQLPVVVTNPGPGGGPSTPVNFDVTTGTPTGNFTVTYSAASGGLTHSQQFTVVVQ